MATPYETYIGHNYRVDFGGKNEFNDYYQITDTNNGITRTLTDNGIKLNGTYNKNANMDLWLSKSSSAGYSNNMTLLKANTQYTISIRTISGSFNISNITCNLSSRTVAEKTFTWNYQTLTLSNNVWKKTFTPTSDIYVGGVRFYFNKNNTTAVFNNVELGIQVEKGPIDTQFSPYVANPIELCKIGSYVDKLKRAEGKNLLDLSAFTTTTSNGITVTPIKSNNNVNYLESSGTYSQTTYITLTNNLHLEPNTKYFLSGGYGPSARLRLREYSSGGSNLSEYFDSGSGISFTTKSNVSYVNVQIVFYAQNNVKFYPMVTEGSTALPYEPYGNNWYVEKNIGKVVLNGTETWTRTAKGSNYVFWSLYTTLGIPVGRYEANSKLCDYFPYEFTKWTTSTINHLAENDNNNLSLLFNVDTSIATTVEQWSSWLSTHNTTVYYALKNPTYEIITNETLIEQLNNIQDLELQPDFCCIDWIRSESPTMLLQYGSTEILNANIITEDGKKIRTDWGI